MEILTMAAIRKKSADLREACIREALAIIETEGVENLSLREVSRRLGISHQAPYKHFASRDHILAEIVSRAFDAFAAYLDAQPRSADAHATLEGMGRAYLDYAHTHPLQYRLMFGTPLPDPAQHPRMMQSARHAFDLLRDCIAQLRLQRGKEAAPKTVELDALFVWSTLHGVSSVLQTRAWDTLSLSDDTSSAASQHLLHMIDLALANE
jgi:AcrR family transcriptional regulator